MAFSLPHCGDSGAPQEELFPFDFLALLTTFWLISIVFLPLLCAWFLSTTKYHFSYIFVFQTCYHKPLTAKNTCFLSMSSTYEPGKGFQAHKWGAITHQEFWDSAAKFNTFSTLPYFGISAFPLYFLRGHARPFFPCIDTY